MATVSEDRLVELIPDCWRSYRESTFANIELSLNKKKFANGCWMLSRKSALCNSRQFNSTYNWKPMTVYFQQLFNKYFSISKTFEEHYLYIQIYLQVQ